MMIKKMIFSVLALSTVLVSCSSDDDNNSIEPTTSNLVLNLSGIEALGDNYVYEGWIIVDGLPVSTGTFSTVTFPQTFTVNTAQLNSATTFVLSIEPTNDLDPDPSATKILAGDFSGNSANVSTDIVGDFLNASGAYFLRTPTDENGTNNGNDENGIWFGTPGETPIPNFNLPTLPNGWAYEGWVVGDSGPLTTGTFNMFNTADNAAPFSETTQAGPAIPGEDFFLNAPTGETFPLDVRNRTVVISIEPVPDNSPAPFTMKPLLGVTGTATAPETHDLDLNLSSMPSGSVSR